MTRGMVKEESPDTAWVEARKVGRDIGGGGRPAQRVDSGRHLNGAAGGLIGGCGGLRLDTGCSRVCIVQKWPKYLHCKNSTKEYLAVPDRP